MNHTWMDTATTKELQKIVEKCKNNGQRNLSDKGYMCVDDLKQEQGVLKLHRLLEQLGDKILRRISDWRDIPGVLEFQNSKIPNLQALITNVGTVNKNANTHKQREECNQKGDFHNYKCTFYIVSVLGIYMSTKLVENYHL